MTMPYLSAAATFFLAVDAGPTFRHPSLDEATLPMANQTIPLDKTPRSRRVAPPSLPRLRTARRRAAAIPQARLGKPRTASAIAVFRLPAAKSSPPVLSFHGLATCELKQCAM